MKDLLRILRLPMVSFKLAKIIEVADRQECKDQEGAYTAYSSFRGAHCSVDGG